MNPETQPNPDLPIAGSPASDKLAAGWLAASRVILALAALQSLTAAALLAWPFSVRRGILATPALLVTLAAVWLLVLSWRKPARFETWLARLKASLQGPSVTWRLALVGSGIIFLTSSYLYLAGPEITEPFTRGLLANLSPMLLWISGLALLCSAALLAIAWQTTGRLRFRTNMGWYLLLGGLAVLFSAWAWSVSNAIPYAAQLIGWNETGTPLLELQVAAAWLTGLAVLAMLGWLTRPRTQPVPGGPGSPSGENHALQQPRWPAWLIDLLIASLLWVTAVIAWQSQPLTPNWFVSPKLPPNSEHYPSSDARVYDLVAQGALVGWGFRENSSLSTRRPLQAFMLLAWHMLGGQNYEAVVFYQLMALAGLPVLVFLLGRRLHSRTAGVIAAVMIIFREANAIPMADSITSTNVKLLMADLPAALIIAGFSFLTVAWLQQPGRRILGMAAGAALGLATLIRPESAVLAIAPAILSGWAWIKTTPPGLPIHQRARRWLTQMLLFIVGATLILTPWLIRNWQVGGFLLLDPVYQQQVVALRLFRQPATVEATPTAAAPAEPTTAPAAQPGAKPTPTTAPVAGPTTPEAPAGGGGNKTGATRPNRAAIALANFLHSQIQMLLILPAAWRIPDSLPAFIIQREPERFWQSCCSLTSYIRRLPYWKTWDGRFLHQSLLPLLINSLVLITGIYAAWRSPTRRTPGPEISDARPAPTLDRNHQAAALAPLAISLIYLAAYAAFRTSGGRYIQPVDWIALLYVGIGLAQVSFWGLRLKQEPGLPSPGPVHDPQKPGQRSRLLLFAVTLLVAGILIPVAEFSHPQRYTVQRRHAMISALTSTAQTLPSDGGQLDRQRLKDFLQHGGQALSGRALYPRYYAAGKGEVDNKDNPLGPRGYPRLAVIVAGTRLFDAILPVREKPARLEHGADVLVLHCPSGDVLAIAVYNENGEVERLFWRDPMPAALSCPLPKIEPGQ